MPGQAEENIELLLEKSLHLNRGTDLLGEVVQDEVTGFKGTVTTVQFHISGLVEAFLEGRAEDNSIATHWCDVMRLEILDEGTAQSSRGGSAREVGEA